MTNSLARILVSLATGAIFGFGLALSGMLDPTRIRGFLDIFGQFDPSLAFVLAGAVMVSSAGYLMSRRLSHPLLDRSFYLPSKKNIDLPLVSGAVIFGVGWGMSGLCPGPAIASLTLGLVPPFVFAAAMLAGMLLHDHWPRIRQRIETGFARRPMDRAEGENIA
ncbi:MAG: YeeE/YedE family protein [Beijerinckiaceae bacterium]|nr:YeeE/YedE family protein [Beijerinckiaceae bacterium]